MHVWNVLHAARCKYRTQKWGKKNRDLGTNPQRCRTIFSQLRRPSRLALAHILVISLFSQVECLCLKSPISDLINVTWICMCGHTSEVVIYSKFHRNQLKGMAIGRQSLWVVQCYLIYTSMGWAAAINSLRTCVKTAWYLSNGSSYQLECLRTYHNSHSYRIRMLKYAIFQSLSCCGGSHESRSGTHFWCFALSRSFDAIEATQFCESSPGRRRV